jgi:hypothetical protein
MKAVLPKEPPERGDWGCRATPGTSPLPCSKRVGRGCSTVFAVPALSDENGSFARRLDRNSDGEQQRQQEHEHDHGSDQVEIPSTGDLRRSEASSGGAHKRERRSDVENARDQARLLSCPAGVCPFIGGTKSPASNFS